MLIQSILLAILGGLCLADERSLWSGWPRSLLAGSVAGLIMGDVTTGVIIAGTLQMMWLANVSIGAYLPPNEPIGAIVGVAIAIMTDGGIAAGLAVAVPTAILGQQLVMLGSTLNITLVHKAEAMIETGDFDKVAKFNLYGLVISFFAGAIPIFLATYFGGPFVESVLNGIPDSVMDGLTVAAGIIPVVGLGMLLMVMMNKNMWIFLLLGFVFASFLGLGTIAISLIGVCFAVLYDLIVNKEVTAVNHVKNHVEEEYDL